MHTGAGLFASSFRFALKMLTAKINPLFYLPGAKNIRIKLDEALIGFFRATLPTAFTSASAQFGFLVHTLPNARNFFLVPVSTFQIRSPSFGPPSLLPTF